MNKVLFTSVHPDDETLGCGGTILKHKAQRDKIYWLIITNISEKEGWPKVKVERRQKEIKQVADEYGFESFFNLNFPPTKLDMIPMNHLITSISKVIEEIKPNTIYIPNRSDVHTDHQISFKAIWSCTKNFRFPYIKKILMYECITETEFSAPINENTFSPNVYKDISEYLEKKINIMEIYESEIMSFPLPRSKENIRALARYRGARISKKYAEAFMLLQEIE